ncbi:unnamed protein product [Arctogadus glacialis]
MLNGGEFWAGGNIHKGPLLLMRAICLLSKKRLAERTLLQFYLLQARDADLNQSYLLQARTVNGRARPPSADQ